MKVIAYVSSVHDDAPDRYRAAARILLPDGTMHPVVFHAPDKNAARARAESWWAEQIEAVRQKKERAQRRAEALRRPVATQTPEIAP